MKLTTRGHYGLIAMVYLAVKLDDGPIPLRTIATVEKIPEQYLEQLFLELRKANLITSVRGAKGGYKLARKPSEIQVGEVIRVLEGPIAPVECLKDYEANCCDKTTYCMTKMVWEKLKDTMDNVLDDMTLADIINQDMPLDARKG
jgi:Rrf2 family protein